jgi:hypothetical protein
MGAINRLCQGVLRYLDTQTQGVNPARFGEEIIPVLDVKPFLDAANGYKVVGASDSGILVPTIVLGLVTVPQGQLWAVKMVSGKVYDPAAAPTIRFQLAMTVAESTIYGGFYLGIPSTATVSLANNIPYGVGYEFAQPYMARGGTSFYCNIPTYTVPGAVGLTVETSVAYVDCSNS